MRAERHSFVAIARIVGYDRGTEAPAAFNGALRRRPPKEQDVLRKAELARRDEMAQRVRDNKELSAETPPASSAPSIGSEHSCWHRDGQPQPRGGRHTANSGRGRQGCAPAFRPAAGRARGAGTSRTQGLLRELNQPRQPTEGAFQAMLEQPFHDPRRRER